MSSLALTEPWVLCSVNRVVPASEKNIVRCARACKKVHSGFATSVSFLERTATRNRAKEPNRFCESACSKMETYTVILAQSAFFQANLSKSTWTLQARKMHAAPRGWWGRVRKSFSQVASDLSRNGLCYELFGCRWQMLCLIKDTISHEKCSK